MRGDDSFSHAAIINPSNDAGMCRAGVTAGVLCRDHHSMPAARRFPDAKTAVTIFRHVMEALRNPNVIEQPKD